MTSLMTKEQLADRLGVPASWVRDAITARRIPITWIGRHARFSEANYEAICAAGHEDPVKAPSAPLVLIPRRRRTAA